MIVRCQRNIEHEAISNNRLYPVIMYEKEKITNVIKVLIVDDGRSLSWQYINHNCFEIISYKTDCYVKETDNEKSIQYIHLDLVGEDFFENYYMENERSQAIKSKLENVLISMLSNEITADDLKNNLRIIGYKDDNSDMILRAFLNNANLFEIREFSEKIYNEVEELQDYIVEIVVEKLSQYKLQEIENLFIKIYMNYQGATKKTLDVISRYLEM